MYENFQWHRFYECIMLGAHFFYPVDRPERECLYCGIKAIKF